MNDEKDQSLTSSHAGVVVLRVSTDESSSPTSIDKGYHHSSVMATHTHHQSATGSQFPYDLANFIKVISSSGSNIASDTFSTIADVRKYMKSQYHDKRNISQLKMKPMQPMQRRYRSIAKAVGRQLSKVSNALMENEVYIRLLIITLDLATSLCYLVEMQFNANSPCINSSQSDSNSISCGSLSPSYPAWRLVYRPRNFFLTVIILISIKTVITSVILLYRLNIFLVSNLILNVPFIILSLIYQADATYIWYPYFVSAILIVPNVKGVYSARNRRNPLPTSLESSEVFWFLLSSIAIFIFFSVCIFNYFQTRFAHLPKDPSTWTVVNSFYFIVTSMTTVGYGDFTPSTIPAQVSIVVLISLAIIVLPGLISEMMDSLKKQAQGAGSFTRGWDPFIIICGDFSDTLRILHMIHSLQRRDAERGRATHIVLLARTPIKADLSYAIRDIRMRKNITYILGTGLEPQDLARVQMEYAKAIYIITKYKSEDPFSEDEHNGLRLIAFDNYAPNTQIYLETRLPNSVSLYEDMATGVVCLSVMMQVFLAYTALYRGSACMLINLLRGSRSLFAQNFRKAPWIDQYSDGVQNEIYKLEFNHIFYGIDFGNLSLYLFDHFQIILFAAHVYLPNRNVHHVLLNPGTKYLIKKGDHGFFIAHDFKSVQASLYLTPEQFAKTKDGSWNVEPLICKVPFMIENSANKTAGWKLGFPPVFDSGSIPECWLLPKVSAIETSVITTADSFSNHFIICSGNFHLFRLISTMRSSHLKPEELVPIVILAPHQPTPHEFVRFSSFPNVYILIGFAHKQSSLLKAGVLRASRVIVCNLNRHHSKVENENDLSVLDSAVITISNTIERLFRDHGIVNSPIVELMFDSNVQFLSPGVAKFVPRRQRTGEEVTGIVTNDHLLFPMFAAGSVLTPSMIEVVLTQTYLQPSFLNLFNSIAGVRYKIDVEIDSELEFKGSSLKVILLPECMVGRTFGELYAGLVKSKGIIPVGILRDRVEELSNPLPFCYTNPVSCLILLKNDTVYVLSGKELE